jgi:enamine deaminase RidA (YjgF/YER057c/UK114 family)
MKDFQKMNEVFMEIFPDDPPARTTVQTPMAEETMLVEIEAVAWIGD